VSRQFAGDFYDRNSDWDDELPDLAGESEDTTE
jgi:hypothetical protein